MPSQPPSSKKRLINFKIDVDLHDWLKVYAAEHNTDVTKLLVGHIKELKAKEEGYQRILELMNSEMDKRFIITKTGNDVTVEETTLP